MPPPLEGTISLGVFDSGGHLVRVLHREDRIDDFTAGREALETTWDGADGAGHPLPAGKYRARGFLVGDLKVEGVDYFFNDWVTDADSPHLAHITRVDLRDGQLLLSATTAGGKSALFLFDPATGKVGETDTTSPPVSPLGSPALIAPVATAPGRDGTTWAIDHLAAGDPALQVVQLSPEPTILRKLAVAASDPQPISIAAAPDRDRIFLLEESPAVERLRSLTLQATSAGAEQAVSDWKVDFTREIVAHRDFHLVDGKPSVAPNDSAAAPTTISQKLRANPLERDQAGQAELAVGFDADGSYLQTADGLPLRTISETPHLSRALISRAAPDAIDVFQDDGAVVEQFRVSHLAEMIAFDCGDFELP